MNKKKSSRSGWFFALQPRTFWLLLIVAMGMTILTCIFTLVSVQLLLVKGFNVILIATGITSLACLVVVLISSWRAGKQFEQDRELKQLDRADRVHLREIEDYRVRELMEQKESPPDSRDDPEWQ